MLYKKIHRQYLREFWKGRKLRFDNSGEVFVIYGEPYICVDYNYICVDFGDVGHDDYDDLDLIRRTGLMWYKDDITWLN